MTTVFKGGEAIKEFLEEFDSWLSESVTVYLLGGSAMTVRGLKDQNRRYRSCGRCCF